MNAGRRHKTPGSDIKDFITHSTAIARALAWFFASVSHVYQVPWGWHRIYDRCLHIQWAVLQERNICKAVRHMCAALRFGDSQLIL